MGALPPDLRKQLENVVVAARRAAEGASRAAIEGLGVFTERRPEHLDADQASLRNGLRAKMRQLGGKRELLIAECAYEQWHRLLFARFLAENRLLLHPEFQAPVTLADCEELANELGEADGWSVAARYAAEILPGIFHLDGPCVRLRLAPEGRHALEQLLDSLPRDVFLGDDALGWVYQFWQKEKKDEINASERKIGGADLGPVTQLFTENYMVRFLLENSLGAWWAARHPKSPLVKGFRYLRVKDKKPAEALFDSWPRRVAEVTVMDPCCGSGHFLVEAFNMLWRMRAEEEGLSAVEAQDAVLRDNLFGLEIDARCLQIAMFALSLQAWKTSGGWRQLPIPNFACSGIPVKARVEQWRALAYGDPRLEDALVRLYVLFSEAETLGSLIDPRRSAKMSRPSDEQFSLDYIDWEAVGPALERAVISETIDPVSANLDASVAALVRAADYLSRRYVLIATNYPYLKRGSQNERLKDHLLNIWPQSRADLATALFSRWEAVSEGQACMLPQSWLTNTRYRHLRKVLLERQSILGIVRLGAGAFHSISGEVVQPALHIQVSSKPSRHHTFSAMDVASAPSPARKSSLRGNVGRWVVEGP